MSKSNTKNQKFNLIDAIFLLMPFCYGIFPIWSLCLLGIICSIGIIYKYKKNNKIVMPKGISIYLIVFYLISFLITEFVAIDKGMNILAFIKNIPILLFIVLLAQYDETEETKNRHFYMISISGVASVIFSLFLMLIPNSNVFLGGRLHGIFYYANSYGLFLLLGVLVLYFKNEKKWYDYLMLLPLFAGIILTNSRAIIVMTIVFSIISIFFNKSHIKSIAISTVSFIMLFVGAYFIANMEKRVSADMLSSSEFVSRIIYYEDAFNIIKSHPFGIGYEGFWYEQAKEQTAIYDTKFVHSSIVQVLLDVGWLPALALVILLGMTFFDKNQTAFNRIIMLAILGHSIIDLDLEYIYFILIIATFINYKNIVIKDKKLIYIPSLTLTVIFSWIFIGDTFYQIKDYKNAETVIPFHSDAIQELLYTVENEKEQLNYANKILDLNKNVSGAYEAFRNDAVKNNEYESALEYEKERLSLNKYKINNYLEYASLISDAIAYYNKNDVEKNLDKIKYCLNEAIGIETSIKTVLDKTNPLCYKTIHTPELDMPQGLVDFIEKCKSKVNI